MNIADDEGTFKGLGVTLPTYDEELDPVRGTQQHGLCSKTDGPNHLVLRYNALSELQMALITSDCAPFTTWTII